ncbi:hypothetical protein ACIA3K_11390 [Micromonospora sp. NPDC051543]|uniref:hypothetical protein n=1 Tax=Micromonospora sp. NPDC051543 TaxID=3364287 RepID=UPI0037B7080D
MVDVVPWPDHVQEVFAGDLVTALAYTTPAGGAVAIPVTPVGSVDRSTSSIGITTSLAFSRKLRQIVRDPRVAMAYHTRQHGFARASEYVLAQGTARVSLQPDLDRLAGMADRAAQMASRPH